MNGGYCLIDAAGLNLSEAEGTLTGLYTSVYNGMDTNKPLVLYNVLKGSDTELLTPLGAVASISANVITLTCYNGKKVTINSNDTYTVA